MCVCVFFLCVFLFFHSFVSTRKLEYFIMNSPQQVIYHNKSENKKVKLSLPMVIMSHSTDPFAILMQLKSNEMQFSVNALTREIRIIGMKITIFNLNSAANGTQHCVQLISHDTSFPFSPNVVHFSTYFRCTIPM